MRFSSTRVLIVSLISLLLPSVVTTVKVTHKGFFSDLFGGFWRSSKQSTRDAVVRDVEDVQDGIKDTGAALKNTGAALLRHGRRTATGAARSFGRALKDGWSSILSKGDGKLGPSPSVIDGTAPSTVEDVLVYLSNYLDDAAERSQSLLNEAASGAMSGLTSASDRAGGTVSDRISITTSCFLTATTLNRLEEQADRLNSAPSTIDRIQRRTRALRHDVRSGYDVVSVTAILDATEGPVGRTISSSPPNARKSMTSTELMIFGKIDGFPRAVRACD
ncbi:hypothetical protein FOZ61_002273 [Perkinsus olseni]|uniref:Uncharacterized protein n=1 Tax=Perkinsus olseni TaxID=32597 RepID=A0A7J6LU28_PEROL|nr:hypothetical protein FOZ61_002273 [Perkinsus olseni]